MKSMMLPFAFGNIFIHVNINAECQNILLLTVIRCSVSAYQFCYCLKKSKHFQLVRSMDIAYVSMLLFCCSVYEIYICNGFVFFG